MFMAGKGNSVSIHAHTIIKGMEWIFHGHVTGEEMLTACMNIYGDSRCDGLTYKVVAFRV